MAYTVSMPSSEEKTAIGWEQKQAELWDRVFQATSDAAALAASLEDDAGGSVIKQELVRTAMKVGLELVRANSAESASDFQGSVLEAKQAAVEVDYWLRLSYVLQQRDDIQRDLSSLITQYASIIELLERTVKNAKKERGIAPAHRARKIAG